MQKSGEVLFGLNMETTNSQTSIKINLFGLIKVEHLFTREKPN